MQTIVLTVLALATLFAPVPVVAEVFCLELITSTVPETLAVPDTETPAASEVMNSLESAFIAKSPLAAISAFSPTTARVAPS